ncbi:MAG: 4-oxalocrotonate tautomerase DmpI [Deltaproteobacteria bacterium]
MPVISMEIGKLPNEQKTRLIQQLSQTAASITNIPLAAFTVIINELEDTNIGIGGKTIGQLKAEAGDR